MFYFDIYSHQIIMKTKYHGFQRNIKKHYTVFNSDIKNNVTWFPIHSFQSRDLSVGRQNIHRTVGQACQFFFFFTAPNI